MFLACRNNGCSWRCSGEEIHGRGRERIEEKMDADFGGNRKGCDLGYALVTNSCEGVDNVDACTIAALDVTTAFAVSNPGCLSQDEPVFSGLSVPRVSSLNGSPSLLRIGENLIKPTLSTVDVTHPSARA
jgi:hypothetical protein